MRTLIDFADSAYELFTSAYAGDEILVTLIFALLVGAIVFVGSVSLTVMGLIWAHLLEVWERT